MQVLKSKKLIVTLLLIVTVFCTVFALSLSPTKASASEDYINHYSEDDFYVVGEFDGSNVKGKLIKVTFLDGKTWEDLTVEDCPHLLFADDPPFQVFFYNYSIFTNIDSFVSPSNIVIMTVFSNGCILGFSDYETYGHLGSHVGVSLEFVEKFETKVVDDNTFNNSLKNYSAYKEIEHAINSDINNKIFRFTLETGTWDDVVDGQVYVGLKIDGEYSSRLIFNSNSIEFPLFNGVIDYKYRTDKVIDVSFNVAYLKEYDGSSIVFDTLTGVKVVQLTERNIVIPHEVGYTYEKNTDGAKYLTETWNNEDINGRYIVISTTYSSVFAITINSAYYSYQFVPDSIESTVYSVYYHNSAPTTKYHPQIERLSDNTFLLTASEECKVGFSQFDTSVSPSKIPSLFIYEVFEKPIVYLPGDSPDSPEVENDYVDVVETGFSEYYYSSFYTKLYTLNSNITGKYFRFTLESGTWDDVVDGQVYAVFGSSADKPSLIFNKDGIMCSAYSGNIFYVVRNSSEIDIYFSNDFDLVEHDFNPLSEGFSFLSGVGVKQLIQRNTVIKPSKDATVTIPDGSVSFEITESADKMNIKDKHIYISYTALSYGSNVLTLIVNDYYSYSIIYDSVEGCYGVYYHNSAPTTKYHPTIERLSPYAFYLTAEEDCVISFTTGDTSVPASKINYLSVYEFSDKPVVNEPSEEPGDSGESPGEKPGEEEKKTKQNILPKLVGVLGGFVLAYGVYYVFFRKKTKNRRK